jgi:hypothetical protein
VICKRGTQADLLICVLRGKVTFEILVEALEGRSISPQRAGVLERHRRRSERAVPRQLRDLAAHVFGGPWAPRRLAILAASIPSSAAAGASRCSLPSTGA